MDTKTMGSLKEFNNLFEKRKNEIMKEAEYNAKRIVKNEMALFRFELFYSTMIPNKKKEQTKRWLREHRKINWAKSLKIAKGDEKKALSIYCRNI